jgi:hypothetical protein
MSGLPSNYPTERDTFRRMEVIPGVARRRRWPRSEKARIVAESYAPGASATACIVIRSSRGGVSLATEPRRSTIRCRSLSRLRWHHRSDLAQHWTVRAVGSR